MGAPPSRDRGCGAPHRTAGSTACSAPGVHPSDVGRRRASPQRMSELTTRQRVVGAGVARLSGSAPRTTARSPARDSCGSDDTHTRSPTFTLVRSGPGIPKRSCQPPSGVAATANIGPPTSSRSGVLASNTTPMPGRGDAVGCGSSGNKSGRTSGTGVPSSARAPVHGRIASLGCTVTNSPRTAVTTPSGRPRWRGKRPSTRRW